VRWFQKTQRASVSADGDTRLRLQLPSAEELGLDLAQAPFVGFIRVGEAFLANEDGWWLVGQREGAIAIHILCAAVDPLLRDSPLSAVADRAPVLAYYDFAEVPKALRSSDRMGGVIPLEPDALQALRAAGTEVRVRSVRDFPRVS
jgi:hypothetical protein